MITTQSVYQSIAHPVLFEHRQASARLIVEAIDKDGQHDFFILDVPIAIATGGFYQAARRTLSRVKPQKGYSILSAELYQS